MLVMAREIDQVVTIGPTPLDKVLGDDWQALEAVVEAISYGGPLGRGVKALADLLASRVDVTFVENRGQKIRLGFDADKRIPIDREEVARAKAIAPNCRPSNQAKAIRRENRAAAAPTSPVSAPVVTAAEAMHPVPIGNVPALVPTAAETRRATEAALKR